MTTSTYLMAVGLLLIGVLCAILGETYHLSYLTAAGPVLVAAGLAYFGGSAHAQYALKKKYGIRG